MRSHDTPAPPHHVHHVILSALSGGTARTPSPRVLAGEKRPAARRFGLFVIFCG